MEEVICMVIPLSHTDSGNQGRIVWIASEAHRKQRLEELGFIPDVIVSCKWKSFRGAIGLYKSRSTTVVLRRKTANEIFVELL